LLKGVIHSLKLNRMIFPVSTSPIF
jgi:hypothetical protein